MNARSETNDLQRFERYAADFEVAVASDDWAVVGRHFAADAVYEIVGDAPLGGHHAGCEAVLAHFKRSLDNFDRAFDTRVLELLEGPLLREGEVWLRWQGRYSVAGAPDLVIAGEESVAFEGGLIARLEDRYPAGAGTALRAYIAEHARLLHPKRGS